MEIAVDRLMVLIVVNIKGSEFKSVDDFGVL